MVFLSNSVFMIKYFKKLLFQNQIFVATTISHECGIVTTPIPPPSPPSGVSPRPPFPSVRFERHPFSVLSALSPGVWGCYPGSVGVCLRLFVCAWLFRGLCASGRCVVWVHCIVMCCVSMYRVVMYWGWVVWLFLWVVGLGVLGLGDRKSVV